MATTELTGAFTPAASRAIGEAAGDTPAIAGLRAEAAAIAFTRPWPDSSRERPWKYLDVSRLSLDALQPALAATPAAPRDLRSCPVSGEHAAVLVQENSETTFQEPTEGGLVVTDFEAALTDPVLRPIVEQHLATGIPAGRSKFTALHYAFLRGGVLVYVPANLEVREPIRIHRSYITGGQFAAPHTLIVTGANSRVTVVEDFTSAEGDIVVTPVLEAVPGPGAQITHAVVHRWGAGTRVFTEERLLAKEPDAAFQSLQLALSGRAVKVHIEASLAGRGTTSELFGLALGHGREHADFYTVQDHIGPDTRSDLLFKSALKDRSRSVYYGLTRVGLGAKNADANQENRNLLLSKAAKADSDPVLEIQTSDIIRASHGATAGPVDEEQLYYLQARGIPYAAAERLLVRAFLGEVVDRLAHEGVREELAEFLDRELAGTGK